jgi:hypothetical protein
MIRAICFTACAAAASGLTQPLTRNEPRLPSVVILGCSVDRYATEAFCGKADKFYRLVCIDQERALNVGFFFHPGVGLKGDMEPPFYNGTRWGANLHNQLSDPKELIKMSRQFMGHEFPDLVVLDSSLWDLATWASQSGKNVADERLIQWGNSDLFNMLNRVSEAFPQSRIVFRTAPTVHDPKYFVTKDDTNGIVIHRDVAVFSPDLVSKMNAEVKKHLKKGKLYGKYEIIDYNKIMGGLIKERGFRDPTLWLKDGYHPRQEASRRYFNKILQLMNMTAVEENDTRQGVAQRRSTFYNEFDEFSVVS